MTWQLHRPSFWPEPRDPWAWQRALVHLAEQAPVADPWPCWEQVLRGRLSRRSVPGLFGLRLAPAPPLVLGMGLLRQNSAGGWVLEEQAESLLNAGREDFQERLANLLARRSPWVRLTLRNLKAGTWRMPRGIAPLLAGRTLRVCPPGGREDLEVPPEAFTALPEPRWLLGDLFKTQVDVLTTTASVESLSVLHGPLYLFHAMGWLDPDGQPQLPDAVTAVLALETPAAALRRMTAEEQDANAYVPFARIAERLLEEFRPDAGAGAHAWADQVFQRAITSGTVEVHAWAPGQPRHGRGFSGDRDRKLVRWTIHDDFTLDDDFKLTEEIKR